MSQLTIDEYYQYTKENCGHCDHWMKKNLCPVERGGGKPSMSHFCSHYAPSFEVCKIINEYKEGRKMSQRKEELIKELEQLRWINMKKIFDGESIKTSEALADFILQREKQILDEVAEPFNEFDRRVNGTMLPPMARAIILLECKDKALATINRLREDK